MHVGLPEFLRLAPWREAWIGEQINNTSADNGVIIAAIVFLSINGDLSNVGG